MCLDKRSSITNLLESTDHLHNVTTSPSLPFAASSNKSSKVEQKIVALAGLHQSNYGSLKKLTMHIGQLETKVKQGFKASQKQNHNHNGSNNTVPLGNMRHLPVLPRSNSSTTKIGIGVLLVVAGLSVTAQMVSFTMAPL